MNTTYDKEQINELAEGVADLSSEVLSIIGNKILERFNKK